MNLLLWSQSTSILHFAFQKQSEPLWLCCWPLELEPSITEDIKCKAAMLHGNLTKKKHLYLNPLVSTGWIKHECLGLFFQWRRQRSLLHVTHNPCIRLSMCVCRMCLSSSVNLRMTFWNSVTFLIRQMKYYSLLSVHKQ